MRAAGTTQRCGAEKRSAARTLALVLACAVSGGPALGHDIPVHKAITANAAVSAFNGSPGFQAFLITIAPDCSYQTATNWLVQGSGLEDNADKDSGGKRSYNHFYDPRTGLGLSDFPNDIRVAMGTNSFTWASVSNCLGVNFDPGFLVPKRFKNVGASNQWAWPTARGYEWLALTSSNPC